MTSAIQASEGLGGAPSQLDWLSRTGSMVWRASHRCCRFTRPSHLRVERGGLGSPEACVLDAQQGVKTCPGGPQTATTERFPGHTVGEAAGVILLEERTRRGGTPCRAPPDTIKQHGDASRRISAAESGKFGIIRSAAGCCRTPSIPRPTSNDAMGHSMGVAV